jgi:hypothetical protein
VTPGITGMLASLNAIFPLIMSYSHCTGFALVFKYRQRMMLIGTARSALFEKWTVFLGRVRRRNPRRLDRLNPSFNLALCRLFIWLLFKFKKSYLESDYGIF